MTDDPNLIERLRFLADTMEKDCRESVAVAPSEEIDSTLKMCADFREAADQLEDGGALLDLILKEMAAATNRDLAADGAVGDEEGAVWRKIESAAGSLQERTTASDPMPTGITMEWLKEAEA